MLTCGHERLAFGDPLCDHLRTCREPWIRYLKWYGGSGLAAELLCLSCSESREKGAQVAVAAVCQECFTHVTTEVGALAGIRGKAGIVTRCEPFDATLVRTELPDQIGPIVDIAPIQDSRRSDWLLLTADNTLVRLNADTLEWRALARATHQPESDREPWNGRPSKPRLHVDQRGEFAALVNDYGRYGQIVDLQRGKVTLALDGGDYHENTVPFSFAFARLRDRTVAIHRTEWNRLDISDPATGELLTARDTRYLEGQERPAHYLDYFHGALCVSPRSGHILDDGWVWHPVGVPTTWSLDRWMFENVWESEQGPTKQDVCAREYYWGDAVCWIDESRLALAGIGDDDAVMIAGARVFDITAEAEARSGLRVDDLRGPRELIAISGPAGEFFSDGTVLYSSNETGLSRWSLDDGARTGHLESFRPTHHHRGAGELVQLVDRTFVRWRSQ